MLGLSFMDSTGKGDAIGVLNFLELSAIANFMPPSILYIAAYGVVADLSDR
jgi:hypothetical protein